MSENVVGARADVTIYDVECTECGKSMSFTADADADGDIVVKAEPCEKCMDKATDAAREEGIKEAQS